MRECAAFAAGCEMTALEWFIAARAVHVAAVVVWIGGVFFVTFVLLPALKHFPLDERLSLFERLERRFGWIARAAIIFAGISGVVLGNFLQVWQRLHESRLWPIHLMIAVWAIFALLLFVLEPLVVHRKFHEFAQRHTVKAMRAAAVMHYVLCALAMTAVAAGVMLAHGWSFL